MMPATSREKRTNGTIDAHLLDAARELGLNVSAISEAALVQERRVVRARAWRAENADALMQRKAWIEEKGTPLSDWQVWRPGS